MNNKGIELSINFMVVFILAIVTFSFGLVIVYNIVASGDAAISDSQNTVVSELRRLSCSSTDNVCVRNNFQQVPVGARAVGFPIQIQNPDANSATFIVTVEKRNPNSPNLFPQTYTLPLNGRQAQEIIMGVSTDGRTIGEHVYFVTITKNGQEFANPRLSVTFT